MKVLIGNIKGPKGDDGSVKFEDLTNAQKEEIRGPQGIQGPQGEKGDTGPQGPEGPQGPKGDTGDTGPQGPKGAVTFSELTEEEIEALRGPQGIQGPKGDKGDKGDTGPAYTLTAADKTSIVSQLKTATFAFDSSTGRLDITL